MRLNTSKHKGFIFLIGGNLPVRRAFADRASRSEASALAGALQRGSPAPRARLPFAPRVHRPINPRGPVRELRGNNMRTLVFATLAVVGLLMPAQADPLHGTCPGCTEATIGGDALTPLTQGVTNFGFSSSPSGATGNLQLKFLIPNSFTLAQVQTFASAVGVVSGTGAHFP